MKSYLIIIMLIGLSNNIFSQSTHIIEPSLIEIIYKIQYGEKEDTYCLRCGKTVSQYFSIGNLRDDSLRASPDPTISSIPTHETLEAIKKNTPSKQRPSSPGHCDYLYWNLSKGKVSVYTSIFGSKYLVEEDIPVTNWIIDEDSVLSIIGYECHKAVTIFRGREWIVWYTKDIPICLGPWKLNGLSGMILKAECKGYITITANNLSSTELEPVTFYNYADYKYEPIERRTFWKLKNNSNSYPANTKIDPPMEIE